MKEKNCGKNRLWIWQTLTFLMLLLVCGSVFIGLYIRTHFEMHLPSDFLKWSMKGESPHFYVYQFSDRLNREGELEDITATVSIGPAVRYVAYPELPEHVINAFVSIEDKRFFDHNGVDWYRTLAASANYLLGFSNQFGGSTITQQLVKNLTGHDEVTFSRKLQEILYALDLERSMDKTEILELYLNVIHFSDRCDGISQAAWHYFSKKPQELSATEAATIAAITNSPTYYNPIRNPANNQKRRDLILLQMYQQGYLSKEDYLDATATPIQLQVSERDDGINSWYVDMVIDDVINGLIEKYGIGRTAASQFLYSGGLHIEMAMDREIQNTVEEYYRTAVKLPQNADGVSAQSALIVIDSRTGDVLGVAGAVGEKQGNRVQNFATQTKRPPGSALKPISVYAPALQEGLINWASVYDDVPVNFGTDQRVAWPRNATGVYRGLTNVAYAVAHSTNTVAVRILEELGVEQAFDYARNRFHLQGLSNTPEADDRGLAALALGQLHYGVTLRELSTAYTVFADGGVYHPWRSYYRVLDREGNILLSCADAGEVVLSEENAAIMTKLLQGVINDGTSSSITLGKTVECAGKTGTTNKDGDRWFVGYTPDLICGVWCGYEYPEPLEGRNICTQIWNRVMHSIVEERGGARSFSVPSDLIRVTYCKDSGELLSESCTKDPRGSRGEIGWFVVGQEPRHTCDCHVSCKVDLENGGVSHGFCPEDCLGEVGLIRVERSFPIQIYVSDAQFVYRGDPTAITPESDPSRPYFYSLFKRPCGISATQKPYHRSCTEHQHPEPPTTDWDYLLPKLLPQTDE